MSTYPTFDGNNNNQQYIPPTQVAPQSQPLVQDSFQPISTTVIQPVIAVNQVVPSVNLEGVLRSKPAFIVCPYCRMGGITRVDTQFSKLNCCCCFCAGLGSWIIFQICRGKDINCTDANHFCVSCGAKLYAYQAC
jgi:hypothetical protein